MVRMKNKYKNTMKRNIYTLIVISLILLSCMSQNENNPLVGEWKFENGLSNEKQTFQNQMNRTKTFKSNKSFYISQIKDGKSEKTIQGEYNIIDENHYSEKLGIDLNVIYEFSISNDTLKFQGELKIPQNNGNFKKVMIKETWTRK